jgi:phage gpG-like protein
MTDALTASVTRLEEVTVKLGQLGLGARERLLAAVSAEAARLQAVIVDEKLTGGVLNSRTGHLREDVHTEIQDGSSGIMAVIGNRVVYARIHEYGGTIVPVTANALRFMIGGKMIFAKSVTMPERSYLRSTLAENQDEIRRVLTAAVAGAA